MLAPGPGHLHTPQSDGSGEGNVASDYKMFPYVDQIVRPWKYTNCGTIANHMFEKESRSHFSKVERRRFPKERRDSEQIN